MEVGGTSTDLGWRDRDAEFEKRAVAHFMKEPESASTNAPDGNDDATTELPRILDRGDLLACARRFLADRFTRDDQQMLYLLYRHRDQWTGTLPTRSGWRVLELGAEVA